MPSRLREFHPEPLTDPDVNLSIHPARAIARRLPPSAERSGSSRFDPVGPSSTAMTCPLRSTGITPLHHYYRAVRPSPAHRSFQPRGWSAPFNGTRFETMASRAAAAWPCGERPWLALTDETQCLLTCRQLGITRLVMLPLVLSSLTLADMGIGFLTELREPQPG